MKKEYLNVQKKIINNIGTEPNNIVTKLYNNLFYIRQKRREMRNFNK